MIRTLRLFRKSKKEVGFTLIELLVVIVIVGVLATLSMVSLNNVRAKTRNSKRVSDIKQIQTALEMYNTDENRYPTIITPGLPLIGPTSGKTYIKMIPQNPPPGTDGGCPDGSEYSYTYLSSKNLYFLSYCLGSSVSDVTGGFVCALPGSVGAAPGYAGVFIGNTGSSVQPECDPCICGDCRSLSCSGLADYQISTASCTVGSTVYHALKIGNQCWMDKNINVGKMILGSASMNDDTLIEKWCYNNHEINSDPGDSSYGGCDTDGGLYTWAEAMYLPSACNSNYSNVGNDYCDPTAYVTGSNASAKRQGLCPKGWHIPSDYETSVLENYLDSSISLSANPDYYAD